MLWCHRPAPTTACVRPSKAPKFASRSFRLRASESDVRHIFECRQLGTLPFFSIPASSDVHFAVDLEPLFLAIACISVVVHCFRLRASQSFPISEMPSGGDRQASLMWQQFQSKRCNSYPSHCHAWLRNVCSNPYFSSSFARRAGD